MSTGRSKNGRFLPGNTFSKGRMPGTRARLHHALMDAIMTDFEEHGADAIIRARKRSPVQYLKVCVDLVPRDVNVTIDAVNDMSDEQLHARLRELNSLYHESFGTTIDGDGRALTPGEDQEAEPLPALPKAE